jgi:E3 ubiquitin-protein ligase SH3RF
VSHAVLIMDEQSLNELLECSVCLERLDHSSKVLPCQHTFCRRCLEEILARQSELRCPECRTLVTVRIEDLPPNILLVRLLEGLKTQGHLPKPAYQRKRETSADGRQHHGARSGWEVWINYNF